jgi:hypothetical protein
MAFSSAGIRSDIRLLSSTASLGIARLLSAVHIQIVHDLLTARTMALESRK